MAAQISISRYISLFLDKNAIWPYIEMRELP
jgi:hypothetical protein